MKSFRELADGLMKSDRITLLQMFARCRPGLFSFLRKGSPSYGRVPEEATCVPRRSHAINEDVM